MPTCETCRFRHEDDCRRFPPLRVIAEETEDGPVISFDFPMIENTLWCGEHQPKPGVV